MLAKELKIQTLKKQREFIKKQIAQVVQRKDGDTAYRYVGHVYPEVIAYFESEGFIVTQVESDMMKVQFKGLPTYLFVVGNVELTEDEIREAEAIEIKEEDDEDDDCPPILMNLCLQFSEVTECNVN